MLRQIRTNISGNDEEDDGDYNDDDDNPYTGTLPPASKDVSPRGQDSD